MCGIPIEEIKDGAIHDYSDHHLQQCEVGSYGAAHRGKDDIQRGKTSILKVITPEIGQGMKVFIIILIPDGIGAYPIPEPGH